MSFRYKFSVVLILLGLISLIMSFGGKSNAFTPPEKILETLVSGTYSISPDELAVMLVSQDSGMQIIDVRSPGQYKSGSIPGAINIPLADLLEPGNKAALSNGDIKTIFCDGNGLLSSQAWMLCKQKAYEGLFILGGGLDEWDTVIMKSKFEGVTISPRENALFEKRFQARRLFVQWNSMPDSLKTGFFAAKSKKDKELVGGCE